MIKKLILINGLLIGVLIAQNAAEAQVENQKKEAAQIIPPTQEKAQTLQTTDPTTLVTEQALANQAKQQEEKAKAAIAQPQPPLNGAIVQTGQEIQKEDAAVQAIDIQAEKIDQASKEVQQEQTVATQIQETTAPAEPVTQQAPITQAPAVQVIPGQPEKGEPQAAKPEEMKPPTVPTPIVEEPIQEDDEFEIKSLDTIDIPEPKGNWLYKRIWWERAERTYEKIKQLTDKLLESRLLFLTRRHEIERDLLDPLFLAIGVDENELDEVIEYLKEKAETAKEVDQERQNEINQEEQVEQTFIGKIAAQLPNLEQLQKEAQTLFKAMRSLDEALIKLIEQLNQARYYEQQAWLNFKAINRELSDKRARELFYAMDTYWRNLNNINSYVSDPFSKYVEQLTEKIRQEASDMRGTLSELKSKGVDIKLQAQLMKKEPMTAEMEIEEEQEPQGWFGTIGSWIAWPFVALGTSIGSFFAWLTSFFTATDQLEELTQEAQSQQPEEA